MRRSLLALAIAAACAPAPAPPADTAAAPTVPVAAPPASVARADTGGRAADTAPAWVRGTTCYEIFVRSFADSDGDGVGDLRGLTARLDHVNDGDPATTGDLGAGCIWLMPIAESPSYHGYDVVDYRAVDREYGTAADFRAFVEAAHRRGIRVVVDMVLNHASSEHPWFRSAVADAASPYRSWFRFSPTEGPRNEWGDSNWHRTPRGDFYFGFFWHGMPDLNYEEPAVLAEMQRVATFWLDSMGVDGFRLDAIRHLVEDGARVRNVEGTHDVLRAWAAHVRGAKPDAWTVGEVWEPTDVLLRYYPDQLDAHFAFEVADSIVSAVRTGRAAALLPPVLRLQRELPPTRWAPFLRNHDQPRTRTELGGSLARARLASFLLLTLPGTPFVYYGEEIGMTGAKPDERIRTPMQWTEGPGAGFTTGTPWQPLAEDAASVTVARQDADPTSILNLHRRLIHLRAANPALGSGELVPAQTSNPAVAAWLRVDGARRVLVVANLGTRPLEGVQVVFDGDVTGTPRPLFGDPRLGARMRLDVEGGRVGTLLSLALEPLEGYVLDLAPPPSS